MNWDLIFVLVVWGMFLFAWLPAKQVKHRQRMKSLQAMNKGHRFRVKYMAIRKLTGRPE